MNRLLTIVAVMVIPASTWAQVPVPPRPPAPPAAPIAPRPITAVWAEPVLADVAQLSSEAAQEAMERARLALDASRVQLDSMNFDMSFDGVYDLQDRLVVMSGGSAYDSGLSLLSRRDYERAVARFDQVIEQKGTRTDAALYHKAYALYRLGRSSEATATLDVLRKDHPKSPYLRDAGVLESAVRQSAGQPISPEQADDDELKLLALNALQHTDPDRALPLLEGVLNGANSLQLKQRAIFVLAQSTQPRAREILMSLARGGGNPDLQRYAIRYLATGGKRGATSAELRAIYDSTQDVDVKKAIILALGQSSGAMAYLPMLSGSADVVEIRRPGADQSGSASAAQDLWSIYQKEQDRDLKMSILARLGSIGAADRLGEVIKSESDAEIRRRAIRSLGSMRVATSGAMLSDLYARENDLDNKKSIISALASQTNGEALVAIARKETNMTLKRDIVSKLSNMSRNKAAMDYMLEIIK